jgi:trigger factor
MQLETVSCEAPCLCDLVFSVPADAFDQAVQRVFAKKQKIYCIPGYEKGAAPRAVIEAARGADVFWFDAVNLLLDTEGHAAFADAVERSGLTPMCEPACSLLEISREKGFRVRMRFALLPALELKPAGPRTAHVEVEPVSEAAVTQEILAARRRHAVFVPTEEPAGAGDRVTLCRTGVGAPAAEDRRVLVLSEDAPCGSAEAEIMGRRAGERIRFSAQGKTAELLLERVERLAVPAEDAAFAAAEGFAAPAAYRSAVRRRMEELARAHAEKQAQAQIDAQFLCGVAGEIPPCIAEELYAQMQDNWRAMLESSRLSEEEFLRRQKVDRAAFLSGMRKHAEDQTRIRLGLYTLAQKMGLEPAPEQIDAEYGRIARARGIPEEKLRRAKPRYAVKLALTEAAAREWLYSHSEIVCGGAQAKKEM